MPDIGVLADRTCSYEEKADWFAVQATLSYLKSTLDPAAKRMLEDWALSHSLTMFHRVFFHRYAVIFGRSSTEPLQWSCRNSSAATVALLRELS